MPHSNRDLLPPPSPNRHDPAKASHSGRKTSALAATATTALIAAPFDVSGISILTAVSSGTLALGGLAYHGGHKALHKIEDRMARHQEKKASAANRVSESQTLDLSHNIPSTVPMNLQTELESCIRRLSCSITGVVVTGSMTFVLPPFLLGVALNSAELVWQARRLHKLTAMAKSRAGIDHYLSSTDITFQVMSGILIKSAVLLCTLGADMDTVIEGFAQLLVSAEVVVDPALIPSTWERAGDISGLYNGLIADGFLHDTTQVAGEPANIVAGMLGYQEMPTWGSGASERDVLEIGAANVLVDLMTGKLVEDPTHEVLDFASRLGRKFGRKKRSEMREMGF